MKFVALKLIRWYQLIAAGYTASPLLLGTYSGCRSWPTCSDYAYRAIEQEGLLKGTAKAIIRIATCNPLLSAQRHG